MNYREYIAKRLNDPLVSESDIVAAADSAHGDFALPCFKYAKELKKSPQAIAQGFLDHMTPDPLIAKTEIAGGYLNFFISRAARAKFAFDEIAGGQGLSGIRKRNKGKTVCIDYSSINIAKPFHIGHLMSTAIGAALYRIYQFLGYTPVGINHLGDWGTQFGKLIAAYKAWGSEDKLTSRGLDELLELYVRFTAESERDEMLAAQGRKEFLKIEQGDPEAVRLFNLFKEITLKEVGAVYERLGITFDSYNGESFYNDKMQPVIDELDAKGLTVISDGAKIVDLEAYGMPPCLITRSDGATLYATRDLAAADYRKKTYGFEKSLYVVATQQNLHFQQVFKVLELMGREWASDCVHVKFGMVSYNGQPLSTRHGHIVFLKDVINTTVEKARKIIEEKNPELACKDGIAEDVGLGAVMFFALGTQRIKDVDFNYDKVLSFEGETAPYLQYTYARCRSVMRKGGSGEAPAGALDDSVFKNLTDDASYEVICKLSAFEEIVVAAAEKYEPSLIAKYLIDLAQSYNRFYIANRVITDDLQLTRARLALTAAVSEILKSGLDLLLIKAPEQM